MSSVSRHSIQLYVLPLALAYQQRSFVDGGDAEAIKQTRFWVNVQVEAADIVRLDAHCGHLLFVLRVVFWDRHFVKNYVTQWREGTMCRAVWEACDKLGKDITFEALRDLVDNNVADATIKNQRQRWNKFEGKQWTIQNVRFYLPPPQSWVRAFPRANIRRFP